ncbi:MAG: methyltransferase domain-containing protein [Candidatus Solibacter sp.]
MTLYNEEFYCMIRDGSRRSARVVVPVVMDLLGEVRSVIDVGCGTGTWLAEFARVGVRDILGLESNELTSQLDVDSSHVAVVDASKPFHLDRCFDLAVSLEVAEHLPEPCAVDFIRSLTQLAPVVLFSAAIPGQGGVGHVNEQWPSYWTAHFAANGFKVVDCLRDRVWRDGRVEWWYRQNLLLFVRQDVFKNYPRIDPPGTLHHHAALDRVMPHTLRMPEAKTAGHLQRRDDGGLFGDRAAALTVSAVVLSKNGAAHIAQCLQSITQSGFADEIVVCVDSTTADETSDIARRFTSHVHLIETRGYSESVFREMASLCRSEFVLRIDDDECLEGNWCRDPIEALLWNGVTHFLVPRCWIVPPGDAFISNEPWFPDFQLRLFRNEPDRIVWPRQIHEPLAVEGLGLILCDRWLNHFDLLVHSRPEREAKVGWYKTLRPAKHLAEFYLYEEQQIELQPADFTGFRAASLRIATTRHERGRSRGRKAPSYYALGTDLLFHYGGNAGEYTLKGWSEPESWGTWTDGYRAEIRLGLERPIEGDALLAVTARAFVGASHPVLRVCCVCEHELIGEWSVESPDCVQRTLEVPALVVAGKTDLLFEFRIANPASPAALAESGDGRLLGLGFSQFCLDHPQISPAGCALPD